MKLALIIITAILLYVLYQLVGYELASRMLGGDPYAEPFGHRVA